ncbi:MAG: carboxypeptidase-like regulatory domain-containing protein [Bacteroidales bacterium]
MKLTIHRIKQYCFLFLFFLSNITIWATTAHGESVRISGRVYAAGNEPLGYASVYFRGTSFGGMTDEQGGYAFDAPVGDYTMVVSMLGYVGYEDQVRLRRGEPFRKNIELLPDSEQLDEVVVVSDGVSRIGRSAFNAVAIDTKALQNTTHSLGDVLSKAPGMKIRESGGVGSDMQLMMDGITGKHIKVFVDGVPQEGVGSSFGLNNIPVNYAERIEVYKGVVPVGFGTDAIGGVINIITRKNRNRWFLDASYAYGSFNTHKSYVNFGQTLNNGFQYEFNLFQNYSDNDYMIDTPVKDFETGAINKKKLERVRRFHDTYHNEALVARVGFVDKPWADRLMVGVTLSQMHKDIQTGVRQEIVFGGKYRTGQSLMPSLEYGKRDLLVAGLDLTLTANLNKNITQNVDTSSYEFNWRGESRPMRLPGEQSYMHVESDHTNLNATTTLNYRLGQKQVFTFNHVTGSFHRNNRSLLETGSKANAIAKETRKHISGLSYRLMPGEKWNISVFGKHYRQFIAGPVATSAALDDYKRVTHSTGAFGYGLAGTFFLPFDLQAKLSYEKALRLPTIEEMFGDEDLESGEISLRPENSDNLNINLTYNRSFGKHGVYVEGGFVLRDTKDYIQRNITALSGGKYGATYVNHGKVKTFGGNLALRYDFSGLLSIGGNFSLTDMRDNVRTVAGGGNQESLTYKARIPNVPYRFGNAFVSFYRDNLLKKGTRLTVTYDNAYMHSFPLYSEALGSESDFVVPTQLSHNLMLAYTMGNGRYHLSFECQNITDARLYDNFSLQKAGRAFYGKFRVCFGSSK